MIGKEKEKRKEEEATKKNVKNIKSIRKKHKQEVSEKEFEDLATEDRLAKKLKAGEYYLCF